jgi:hypothetical protein
LIELSLRETKKKKDLHSQEAKLASKEGATPTRKKDMMEGLTVLLKEKEGEMEAALYANCLLLGLDASVLGPGVGTRAGLFRHSNPRVGEALLHFLLCALRGPYLSSKDFAGVWPIFDAAQSRDFRKVRSHLLSSSSHGLTFLIM